MRTQYVEEISRHIICENLGGYEGVEDLIDELSLSTSAETVKQIMYAVIPPPLPPVKEMSMLHDRIPRISFILGRERRWSAMTTARTSNCFYRKSTWTWKTRSVNAIELPRLWPHTQDTLHLEACINALDRGFEIQKDYYNGISLAYMLNVRAALPDQSPEKANTDYLQARHDSFWRPRRGTTNLWN